ncbi:MAG: hypothetical protein WAV28_11770 [Sedimentisphaerales bacterium]
MITEYEKDVILRYAKKYNVSSVFLFGSSIEKEQGANDIDLGVRGIEKKLFFKFMPSWLSTYQNLLILLIYPKNLCSTILSKKPE